MPPERLFRLLLRHPRPVLPIAFRLPFAPHVALSVRGITALEDAEVVDVDPTMPEEVRRSEVARRLIAVALLADGALAFGGADDVGGLTDAEVAVLTHHVATAAHAISPVCRVAGPEWMSALERGAAHPSNASACGAIWSSVEVVATPRTVITRPRPDRYFGMPLADMTDGQRMAYAAAKSLFDKKA